MTGEQLELVFMTCGCALGTLVGFGVVPIGPDTPKLQRARRMLRRVGPPGTVLAIALLAASFVR